MKTPKSTPEKPAPKAKAEQPVAAVATKAPTKNPSPAKKTLKKAEVVAPKPVEATPEKAMPKNPSPAHKAPKKAQVVASKPVVATPEITIPEQVGLAAGSIWHYLAENGATSVAKLVKELSEEEKIIQRSIGWLAQEGKISLDVVNRVETLALKK